MRSPERWTRSIDKHPATSYIFSVAGWPCTTRERTPRMTRDVWNPLEELVRLRRRFNELFERSFVGPMTEDQAMRHHWEPPIDVYREGDKVVVLAEIPGVSRDQIDLEFKGNRLSIRGLRHPSSDDGQAVYHRLERQHGPFERVVILNDPIIIDAIRAGYADGILTIELPLRVGPVTRKIELASD